VQGSADTGQTPSDAVADAVASAAEGLGGLGRAAEVVGLFTDSPLLPLMEELMGGAIAGTAEAPNHRTDDGGGGKLSVSHKQATPNVPRI